MLVNDDYKNCIDDYIISITNAGFTPCLVTDPPFNIGYHYNEYKDKKTDDEYFSELVNLINKFKYSVIVHYPEQLHRLSIELNKAPERVCSWVYNSNTPKQHRDIAFYGFKPDMKKRGQEYKNKNDKRIKKLIEQGKRARLYDWWNINQVKNVSKEKTNHPCQMPVDVMLNICGSLPDGVYVIDPFMGSGSTNVACNILNIPNIGIELNKEYFDIAKSRCNNA